MVPREVRSRGIIVDRAAAWLSPDIVQKFPGLIKPLVESQGQYLESGTRHCQDRSLLACPGKLTSGR